MNALISSPQDSAPVHRPGVAQPASASTRLRRHLPLMALGLLAFTGCINLEPKPDPTRYYVIEGPASAGAIVPEDCSGGIILVGPVRVAGYADQSAIVERRANREIRPLALHRWAEAPASALPRVLVSRLSREIPGACVVAYQRMTPDDRALQVDLELTRFELTDRNEAVVGMIWRVFQPGNPASTRSSGHVAVKAFEAGSDRIPAGVNALSEALDEVVRQLAGTLSGRTTAPDRRS